MIDLEAQAVESTAAEAIARPLVSPLAATWRYLGERAAADDAYCARFGVSHAPEPSIDRDKVLAYALPMAPSH